MLLFSFPYFYKYYQLFLLYEVKTSSEGRNIARGLKLIRFNNTGRCPVLKYLSLSGLPITSYKLPVTNY
ncbi:MAG: hypothetical protein B6I20_05725 [Bacteroidetes bacterium 4572_117]|nr:MAG: hypothetical protein B6I20_05725 [Bacteroidetes bacterium 4572_117]